MIALALASVLAMAMHPTFIFIIKGSELTENVQGWIFASSHPILLNRMRILKHIVTAYSCPIPTKNYCLCEKLMSFLEWASSNW
jgi:hypothetical protein